MKILLVMPSIKERVTLYDRIFMKFTMWEPLTLRQIAACTPEKHDVTLINENHRHIRFSGDYDLVGISSMTATAPRAYKIADEFRARGVKVVLGGYHPTAMPEEAKQHADAVVIGEAEEVWPQVIKDVEKGKLRDFYRGTSKRIASPISNNGALFGYVEASRGCVNKCDFCAIASTPMGKYRKKSIDAVVQEIESMKNRGFVFYDSSLTIDIEYTKELFRRIKETGKRFACFGNANVLARDDELLSLAYDAGCVAWAVGFESVSQESMINVNKKSNRVEEYGKVIRKVNEHGMALIGSFVFGFDYDPPDIFDTTLKFFQEWNIDSVGVNILTPLPGTPLFDEMKRENRILTRDWSKYDFYHVVHKPRLLSPAELYEGVRKITREFFSAEKILKRLLGKRFGFITRMALAHHLLSSKIGYSHFMKARRDIFTHLHSIPSKNPDRNINEI
ncbi:MAG: B12-binding domain-containing radical SAM protein [Thermoplasmata archaeon]|nr:B12-binding domain-containing radical SAM protein [Thermoplasmata archaeon]